MGFDIKITHALNIILWLKMLMHFWHLVKRQACIDLGKMYNVRVEIKYP